MKWTTNEKYTYPLSYPTGKTYMIFTELPRGNHYKSFLALFHLVTAMVWMFVPLKIHKLKS